LKSNRRLGVRPRTHSVTAACLALLAALATPAGAGEEPIGSVRQMYDGALTPDLAVSTFRHIERLFPTRTIAHGDKVSPLLPAEHPLTRVEFVSRGKHWDLDDYLAVNRVAGLLVLKNGRVALETYQYGNKPATRWM